MDGFNKKVIIVNSYANYGGPIVLSELCRNLQNLGIDARLLMVPFFPMGRINKVYYKMNILWYQFVSFYYYFCHVFFRIGNGAGKEDKFLFSLTNGCRRQFHPFFNKKKSVVIYPEIVWGNPLDATNVVRWLLYKTKYKNIIGAYSKNDLFIAYREVFDDISLNPNHYIVNLSCFNKDLYKRYNYGDRKGKCYIIRKGAKRFDLPNSFDGPIVDQLSEKEKVEIFNECEYCFSYDTQTTYSSIAAVCGCISIVVPEPGKTRKDYRGEDDNPGYGIAYGDDIKEIEWALSTIDNLIDSLDSRESNIKNAKSFVGILDKHFS